MLKYRHVSVLDPVMGDRGRLYVSPDIVPVYKSLLSDADLILPNQFEAEYVLVSSFCRHVYRCLCRLPSLLGQPLENAYDSSPGFSRTQKSALFLMS